jgi:hypothetical protein
LLITVFQLNEAIFKPISLQQVNFLIRSGNLILCGQPLEEAERIVEAD